MKKLLFVFLVLVLSSQPANAVLAFVPAASRVLVPWLTSTTGQTLVTGPIGIGLAYAIFSYTRQDANGTQQQTDLYQTNALRQPTAAESAAGFTAGSPSLVPPSSAAMSYLWQMQTVGQTFPDGISAAQANVAQNYSAWTADDYFAVGDARYDAHLTAKNNPAVHQLLTSASNRFVSCPLGYVASGTNCVLSSASAVVRPLDGFCPITRSGSTYTVDTADPDCQGSGAAPSFAADGSFSVVGADGSSISATGNGTGNHTIVYDYPDSSRNVTHERTLFETDGSTAASPSTITGTNDREFSGQGSGTSTTPSTSTVTNNNVNVDLSPVVQAINADTASREAWNAAEPARKAADRAAEREIPITGEIIPKENIPFVFTPEIFASSASCPAPIAFTMLGKSYSIEYDPMCNVMTTMRPLILAFGAFAAAFIFIGGLRT